MKKYIALDSSKLWVVGSNPAGGARFAWIFH